MIFAEHNLIINNYLYKLALLNLHTKIERKSSKTHNNLLAHYDLYCQPYHKNPWPTLFDPCPAIENKILKEIMLFTIWPIWPHFSSKTLALGVMKFTIPYKQSVMIDTCLGVEKKNVKETRHHLRRATSRSSVWLDPKINNYVMCDPANDMIRDKSSGEIILLL